MIKALIFIMKYKILKEPTNLSYQTKEFFKLSKKTQRKVLDKYFDKLDENFSIESYFDTKESRYYDNHQEISFFNCYYFDKLIIEYNITNIKLIDKFKLSDEKIDFLINYTLDLIKEDNLTVDASDLVNYTGNIPTRLSKNIKFMKYLIGIDCYNIKYLTHNELSPAKQRDLIKEGIAIATTKPFNINNFLINNNTLPEILETNLDFILYLIENNIENVKYLNDKFLNNLTISNKDNLIKTIIYSLEKNSIGIDYIENNMELALFLNRNEDFINYILKVDLKNVKYIDWHNLTDKTITKVINDITNILNNNKNHNFNIMDYSFRNIFFSNYNFMEYLIKKDFRWIAIIEVNDKTEIEKLINLFFNEIKTKKYKFKLSDFLEDGNYLNYRLIENKKMFNYLFNNNVKLAKHINFFNLKSSRTVVENLVDELEKTPPEYEFNNDDYLIDNKYPIILSNNYRFMRYVIDKNFNNLAYINPSMIDKRELKRIINYAFKMVYYIRGKNKKLNFDLEGYFKNSKIIEDDYFQECLRSL